MKDNNVRNAIEIAYFDAEVAIRPLIDSFVSTQERITKDQTLLIKRKVRRFRDLIIQNLSDKDLDQKNNIKDLFTGLNSYVDRVVTIANKREDLDIKKRMYENIIQLNEFFFFTSAVITGYIVSPIIAFSSVSIPVLGILGLFLYFLNEVTSLMKILSTAPRYDESCTLISPNIKKIEEDVAKMNSANILEEIHELENILMSTDPENTLSLEETVLLEKLYAKQVAGDQVKTIISNLKDRDIKRGLYLYENLLQEYIKIFVLSLSAVDSNRPIPKPVSVPRKIFSSKGITKFLGYVLLNSVTFTFFYNSFENNKIEIVLLTIIAAVGAFYFISLLEKGFANEISKLLENIHKKE